MTQENILKPTDLMIGDWIQFPDGTHRVYSIDGYNISWVSLNAGYHTYEISKLKPINLSSEILEKNGWKERPTGYVFYTDGKRYDNSLWYIFGSNTFVVDNAEFQINYVHQLQHALKLCGIEKEIIL